MDKKFCFKFVLLSDYVGFAPTEVAPIKLAFLTTLPQIDMSYFHNQ